MARVIRWAVLAILGATGDWLPAAPLKLIVVDHAGTRLPCRVHLTDADGAPQRALGLPFWRDHFVCPGEVDLDLPPGQYQGM